MAGPDDEIDIIAELTDRVSRPAERARESIEDLGDEVHEQNAEFENFNETLKDTEEQSKKTGGRVEELTAKIKKQENALADSRAELRGLRDEYNRTGSSNKELAKEIRRVELSILKQESAINKTSNALIGYTLAMNESGEVSKKTRRENEKTTRSYTSLFERLKSGEGIFGKVTKSGIGFIKGVLNPLRFFKWAAIATGISFLLTAVEGLGVAGFAGVAGLAPLTGMLIAYPGLIANVVGAFAVMKLATGGMGEAYKVLSDPEATAEELEAATKNLGQNQLKFLQAVIGSRKQWLGLKKDIGDTFFKDLDKTYENLSETYFPILDKYLPRQAESLRKIVNYTANYLKSQSGQKTMERILQGNVHQTEEWGKGFVEVGRIVADLLHFATPMLNEMSSDFHGMTVGLRKDVEDNGKDLRDFFNGSYDLFKRVSDVVGDYAVGIYNLGKLSRPLYRAMGGDLEDLGEKFRAFTEDKGNKKDIRGYFRDMIPVVRELGNWLLDIGAALRDISMDNGDFVKTSRSLRQDVLPMIVDGFDWLAGVLPGAIDRVKNTYDNLKEGGVLGGFGRAVVKIADGLETAGEKVAGMPDWGKKALAVATGLYAGYKIMNRITGGLGGKAAGSIASKLFPSIGVQKVYVTNWPTSFGGPDIDGPGGKEKKSGKTSLLKKAAPFAATGGAYGLAGLVAAIAGGAANEGIWKLQNKVAPDSKLPQGNPGSGQAMAPGSDMGDLSDAAEGWRKTWNNLWGNNEDVTRRSAEQQQKDLDSLLFGPMGKSAADTASKSNSDLQNLLFSPLKSSVKESQAQGDDLMGVINKIGSSNPKPKVTLEGGPAVEEQTSRIRQNIDSIPASKNINVSVNLGVGAVAGTLLGLGLGNLTPRYTGGETKAGRLYMTGEHGPEAFISKATGKMSILGANGPEVAMPGAGAVIPHSGTKDPDKGSMGLAPGWAAEAYRKMRQAATPTTKVTPVGGGEHHVHNHISAEVNIPVYNPQANVDVEKAVRKALDELAIESKERD